MELFSSWTGSDFLLFYVVLLGFAGLVAWWIPANLRGPGRRGTADDFESIALLTGGRARLVDSLLADLYVRGALLPTGTNSFSVKASELSATPAVQALLADDAPVTLARARKVLVTHVDRVAARLQRSGLLLRPEDHTRLRWLSVTPFAALLMLGLYRQRAGSAVSEPTGFLVILLVLTLVLAILRFAKSDPRTVAGIALVHEMRAKNGRFARAPRPEEAAMAVALFGTAVLVGTPWEPVHAMRQKESGGGDSSGSDSGSGDSDGGGGCGGCGG